jgi:hypothetical protein
MNNLIDRRKKLALETYELVKLHGDLSKASRAIGVPRATLQGRLNSGVSLGLFNDPRYPEIETDVDLNNNNYQLPPAVDDDIDIDSVVDLMTRRFEKRKEYQESKRWQKIKMKSNSPIALFWMGDPHVDDDGCDWVSLRNHIDLINSDDHCYGCSLGDLSNNWVGRLSRLYANQETSQKTAWRLVEWLIKQMNPLILISGNHDMWSGSGDPIKWMKQPHTFMEDWEARIEIEFPNKRSCRIYAAHDMAGHSMWNPLHAQTKQARFNGSAELYISGHRHNWALAHQELVDQEKTVWMARARGYKMYDSFAKVKGFDQQRYGQSIVQVIDPNNPSEISFNMCFADPEEAVSYLKYRKSLY